MHHKTANDYHKDPWVDRNYLDNTDPSRDTWYSPYQQFSPPQIQYKPSVSHPVFAVCALIGTEADTSTSRTGDVINLAQVKGKAVIMKRNFCNSGRWSNNANPITYTQTIN